MQGMEGGLEKIQTLEDSSFRMRDERVTESRGQAPVFTVPLSNIDSLREGENAHFEARLTPTDDPKLKVSLWSCSFCRVMMCETIWKGTTLFSIVYSTVKCTPLGHMGW
jgi:hypothetical protein